MVNGLSWCSRTDALDLVRPSLRLATARRCARSRGAAAIVRARDLDSAALVRRRVLALDRMHGSALGSWRYSCSCLCGRDPRRAALDRTSDAQGAGSPDQSLKRNSFLAIAADGAAAERGLLRPNPT
jgi:hypothetical protein